MCKRQAAKEREFSSLVSEAMAEETTLGVLVGLRRVVERFTEEDLSPCGDCPDELAERALNEPHLKCIAEGPVVLLPRVTSEALDEEMVYRRKRDAILRHVYGMDDKPRFPSTDAERKSVKGFRKLEEESLAGLKRADERYPIRHFGDASHPGISFGPITDRMLSSPAAQFGGAFGVCEHAGCARAPIQGEWYLDYDAREVCRAGPGHTETRFILKRLVDERGKAEPSTPQAPETATQYAERQQQIHPTTPIPEEYLRHCQEIVAREMEVCEQLHKFWNVDNPIHMKPRSLGASQMIGFGSMMAPVEVQSPPWCHATTDGIFEETKVRRSPEVGEWFLSVKGVPMLCKNHITADGYEPIILRKVK